jgi:hypothetical protein
LTKYPDLLLYYEVDEYVKPVKEGCMTEWIGVLMVLLVLAGCIILLVKMRSNNKVLSEKPKTILPPGRYYL